MEKLAPGGDEHTLHALRLLRRRDFGLIVDAGCGSGRQTLALARELRTPIHALDTHQPFLDDLGRRAQAAGLGHLVQTHCMDMNEIPRVFRDVDLLWSEGAAYNIGFRNALATWAGALAPGGLAAVSELSWLKAQAPKPVVEFFGTCYPEMQSVARNTALAEEAGYRVLETYTLPPETWTEGYYDVLGPKARMLLDHPEEAVRALAAETVKEIEVFEQREDSYGYVFYLLQLD